VSSPFSSGLRFLNLAKNPGFVALYIVRQHSNRSWTTTY